MGIYGMGEEQPPAGFTPKPAATSTPLIAGKEPGRFAAIELTHAQQQATPAPRPSEPASPGEMRKAQEKLEDIKPATWRTVLKYVVATLAALIALPTVVGSVMGFLAVTRKLNEDLTDRQIAALPDDRREAAKSKKIEEFDPALQGPLKNASAKMQEAKKQLEWYSKEREKIEASSLDPTTKERFKAKIDNAIRLYEDVATPAYFKIRQAAEAYQVMIENVRKDPSLNEKQKDEKVAGLREEYEYVMEDRWAGNGKVDKLLEGIDEKLSGASKDIYHDMKGQAINAHLYKGRDLMRQYPDGHYEMTNVADARFKTQELAIRSLPISRLEERGDLINQIRAELLRDLRSAEERHVEF